MRSKISMTMIATLLSLCASGGEQAFGQCILTNPSFEIGGQGGAVFGGWNQFGAVGSVNDSYHGSVAARVTGPDYGGWDVSAYWQSQDCQAGERWEITGHVRHPSSSPLTGQNIALVNIEWRDALGDLIDYDTFTIADTSSPLDEYIDFSLLSTAAPTGTLEARLLLGVLQSPDDLPSDVHFDEVTFYSTTPPTIDDLQWSDFPGGRTLEFAGRIWRVKGPGYYGPGPSNFCHLPDCVWVDGEGRLHLSIKLQGSTWTSTEVVLDQALGYGDYIFTTKGAIDLLDIHAVLGLFIWQYGPCWDPSYLWWNPYNEIDVEISRWGDPGRDVAQFVVQPYDWGGNISRFDASFGSEELSSYAFNWLPDHLEFRSWRGGSADESPENMIHEWTYTGAHIPRPEQPRVHLNLWQYGGAPATEQEVIFDDFAFMPADGYTGIVNEPAAPSPFEPAARLYPAMPNPFNPRTTIRYALLRDGIVDISVYDVSGAHVRTLVNDFVVAGEHETDWNGRNGGGKRMASGVYLCRLQTGDVTQAQRMVLVE